MASLTQTSIMSRKVIRYGLYALIAIVVLRLLFRAGVGLYKRVVPPPKPQPTVAFGILPTLPFHDQGFPKDITYTLELPTGSLPQLQEITEVYFMPPQRSGFGELDQARAKAKSLGFNQEGRILVQNVPNVYIFTKSGIPSNLTMNIITGIFSISYDLNADPTAIDGIPPTPEVSTTQVTSYLNAAGYLDESLQGAVPTTELLKIEGGKFVPAVSLSEADMVKVNLFRKPLGAEENIPSVTPDMPEANVWFVIGGVRRQIIASEFHHFPVDTTKFSTYPLKTTETAWQELTSGGGYIANLGTNEKNVIIRKVYLAYYDPGEYAEYYQPVIVFEGDNGFYGYVPAVTSEYYGGE